MGNLSRACCNTNDNTNQRSRRDYKKVRRDNRETQKSISVSTTSHKTQEPDLTDELLNGQVIINIMKLQVNLTQMVHQYNGKINLSDVKIRVKFDGDLHEIAQASNFKKVR